MKMKINQFQYLWFWHHSSFKISSLEKLTSIFASFSNFFKYLFSNFLSSHLYNIFIIYFSSSSPLLKSLFSTIFNFSCYLTFTFILPLNSTTTSFIFFIFSFFSQLLCSAVNLFHYTRYFTILFIFLLFKIFSTFYFLTPSTSTGFAFFTFYSSICSLYYTIQLTFTTRWILIKVGSCSLTILVDTILSIKYRPTYWSTNFLLVSSWIPSSLYSILLYLSFSIPLLFFSFYLPVTSFSPMLSLILLLLLLASSSFFLQTLSLFLSFSFF